jgi:hypothetical protein
LGSTFDVSDPNSGQCSDMSGILAVLLRSMGPAVALPDGWPMVSPVFPLGKSKDSRFVKATMHGDESPVASRDELAAGERQSERQRLRSRMGRALSGSSTTKANIARSPHRPRKRWP